MSYLPHMQFGIHLPGDETELDSRITQHLEKGYELVIDRTWDNKLVEDHDPVRIKMSWYFQRISGRPHKRVIKIHFEAPLMDDDPPESIIGHCPDLYNYECVEFFFMNEKGHYLEVEVGPHGHSLVLLHSAYRKVYDNGENIELDVINRFDGETWICDLEIPLAYLPGAVTRFNAYALHGMGDDRHYEALCPVMDGSLQKPDFHRKEYFMRFDIRRVVPEGYNRKPWNDLKYGNMWETLEWEEDQ